VVLQGELGEGVTAAQVELDRDIVAMGDVLSVRLFVRIATKSTRPSATARLWYDDTGAASAVRVLRDGTPVEYFLRSGSGLDVFPGAAPEEAADVLVHRRNRNRWEPFGEWSLTLGPRTTSDGAQARR
jgi:hypothetical protein